jgi:hypothetical protein
MLAVSDVLIPAFRPKAEMGQGACDPQLTINGLAVHSLDTALHSPAIARKFPRVTVCRTAAFVPCDRQS